MFCEFCVAYFQWAALKSVQLNAFLNNFFVYYPIGTKQKNSLIAIVFLKINCLAFKLSLSLVYINLRGLYLFDTKFGSASYYNL